MTRHLQDSCIIISVSLSTFLGMVAMSGINISLPVIVTEFNTTLSHAAWVVNGYLLILAGFIVIIGRLADRRGLKRTFLEGIIIFSIGSLFCFLSWDLNSLIVSRIVQAIGASMFIASGPALIATLVSPLNQGKGQSVNTIFSPLGAAFGIGIAGIVTDYIGWRYLFLLTLPIGTGVYLVGKIILSEVKCTRVLPPFDIRGSVMIFLTLVLFLAGCTLVYIPSSGYSFIFLFACSVLTGISFFHHQKASSDSVLTVSLIKNRDFSTALISSLFLYSLHAGLNYFVPLILVYFYYLSSADAGLYLMAVGLGSTVFAFPAGKIADQHGPRGICIGACCIIIFILVVCTIIPKDIQIFYSVVLSFQVRFYVICKSLDKADPGSMSFRSKRFRLWYHADRSVFCVYDRNCNSLYCI